MNNRFFNSETIKATVVIYHQHTNCLVYPSHVYLQFTERAQAANLVSFEQCNLTRAGQFMHNARRSVLSGHWNLMKLNVQQIAEVALQVALSLFRLQDCRLCRHISIQCTFRTMHLQLQMFIRIGCAVSLHLTMGIRKDASINLTVI